MSQERDQLVSAIKERLAWCTHEVERLLPLEQERVELAAALAAFTRTERRVVANRLGVGLTEQCVQVLRATQPLRTVDIQVRIDGEKDPGRQATLLGVLSRRPDLFRRLPDKRWQLIDENEAPNEKAMASAVL